MATALSWNQVLMTNDTPTSTTTAAVGGSSSGTIDDDTVGSPPTSSGQATTIHIPRSIAHSEVAVTRHKRLQKTKLCKYGEDCAYGGDRHLWGCYCCWCQVPSYRPLLLRTFY